MRAGSNRRQGLRALVPSAALALVIAGAVLVIRVVDRHQKRAANARTVHSWTKVLAKAKALRDPKRLREADSVVGIALQMALDSAGPRETTGRPENQDVAECLEMKAGIAYALGRVSETESLERLAVRIRARDSTDLGPMTNDLGMLGMIAGEQRRFPEAESLYGQVYELGENGLSAKDDAAFGLDRPGMLRLAQGDLAGPESLLQQAAQRYRAIGGEQPQLPIVLDSLAKVLDRQGGSIESDSALRAARRLG